MHGPAFGSGLDIYVANGANSNTDSYTSIGYSYQLPPGESAKAFFTGSFRFQAAEVEVFRVQAFGV